MTATIHAFDPDARPKRERPKREPKPKKVGRPAKVAATAPIIGRLVAIIDQGVSVVENPDLILPAGSAIPKFNRWAFPRW